MRRVILLAGCGLRVASACLAQQPALPAPRDTLRLEALQQRARSADPRGRQADLQARGTALRLESINAERLPAFSAEGQAQYQSDVVAFTGQLPLGITLPSPAHDSYDARINVQQPIFSPSLAPRRAVETATLAETNAQLQTTLYALRQEVTESFFAAASLQERSAVIDATIADLTSRLEDAAVRVREGTALPSDTLSIRATILLRRQDQAEILANRRAAIARLSALTGQPIAADARVELPDLVAATSRTRSSPQTVRDRPEYALFAETRNRLSAQEALVSARQRPRVSAFGRLGYGRPGLNLLADSFDPYWIAGVQVQWAPWTWDSDRRERETIAIQRDVVSANEAAFSASLERAVQGDLAAIDRLEAVVQSDDEIIGLRLQIERETQIRFGEGVVTASDYLARSTDVLTARLARAVHGVELVQARARLLTTLGVQP